MSELASKFISNISIRPERILVVVPVYRDVELTKACLVSAKSAVMRIPGARLVAINDASPDADMEEMLLQESALWNGRFIVINNKVNLGFVKSANLGIRHDEAADIVLLNNDVILPDQWLDRLIDDAYAISNAGTVTPMSNNTTISAFPNFIRENPPPLGLDLNHIDKVFRLHRLNLIEAPTAIGFCMYIKRGCLNDTGYLDEVSFGTGYGEENDFCQRAISKGWKNYISPNLYVHHRGGVSFGGQRVERIKHANQILDHRYPNYHKDVQAFIIRDDLRVSRLQRYFNLVVSSDKSVVLHVSHGLGGGVGQHINELAKKTESHLVSLILQPEEEGRLFSIGAWNADASMRVLISPKDVLDILIPFLKAIGVGMVHYHHVLNLPMSFLSLGLKLDVEQIFTVHDYYLVNGNPTLTNEKGFFDPKLMDNVRNPLYPLPRGITREKWREQYSIFLHDCTSVIFPSQATFAIFKRYFNIKNHILAYHSESVKFLDAQILPFGQKNNYTIGVLGALSREKGADLLENIAILSASSKLNINFVLIGYAYRPLDKVKIIGPYENEQLRQLIRQEKCDLIFFPALWPETYSYTLSAAMATGLPIIAPNIGAFPERLNARKHTFLFEHPASADELLKDIVMFIKNLEENVDTASKYFEIVHPSTDFYDCRYAHFVSGRTSTFHQAEVHARLFELLAAQKIVKRQWREKLLYVFWKIYTYPGLKIVFKIMPHQWKRAIKRAISTKPLHELLHK